jgi:rhodanese-related sulfurtransferase
MKTLALACLLFLASAARAGDVAAPCGRPASAAPTPNVASACAPAAPAAPESPIPHITGADLQHLVHHADEQLVILDVRTPEEFAAGHLPEARNIPHDQVADRLVELAPLHGKTVVLYCRSGRRSGIAAKLLRDAGFGDVRLLEGDFPGWEAAKYPVERASAGTTPAKQAN